MKLSHMHPPIILKPLPSPPPMMLSQPVQLILIRVIRLLPPFSVPRHLSTNRTPYPLQYEMIVNHPPPPRQLPVPRSSTEDSSSSASFEDFLDDRLKNPHQKLDKAERKYLNKRRRRLLGTDSEDEEYRRAHQDELVELQPEIVRFKSLYEREEELFFYDQCAFPWDENKHYRMTYQLEKKYFPNKGFDKAFLDSGMENKEEDQSKTMSSKGSGEEGTVFFQNHNWVKNDEEEITVDALEKKVDDVFKRLKKFPDHDAKADVAEKKQGVNAHLSEKKVGDFFKELRRGPIEDGDDDEPQAFLSSRRTGLPAKWETPQGTVLLVNKPKGWTSFTVCGKLRRLVNVKKVGHAGTLDPMATGLLIVCVGKSTKIVDRFQGMVKGYSGIFRLGEATSTWDADSPVIQREPWEHIKDADLKKVIDTFSGEIWQVPPMFSAIKVGGEKLYEKARRGENIELSPRRISIFQFDLERSLDDRQNLIFRVTCSKGTYIRSLCADLGKALGSCAHLTALRRDSIGEYLADDAWDFKELEEEITKGYM